MNSEMAYPRKQGPVSRKSRKLFGPKKPLVKLPTACFGKVQGKVTFIQTLAV